MSTESLNQVCTFRLGKQLFGIDVLEVQEVIPVQEMTPVPNAPPAVSGLINLRGQIVTALDLRVQLGLPRSEKEPMNIVVRTTNGPVALLVDEIGDVVETRPENFEPAPSNLPSPAKEVTEGVFKLEKDLLLVLSVARTVGGTTESATYLH